MSTPASLRRFLRRERRLDGNGSPLMARVTTIRDGFGAAAQKRFKFSIILLTLDVWIFKFVKCTLLLGLHKL